MKRIDGQAVLEKYDIRVGELVQAILDGLPAYDAVTGARVVDQDAMIARPKYETEVQAAKAVDLIDAGSAASRMRRGEKPFSTYSPGGSAGIDEVVRRNKIRLFMETANVYEFPKGQERPQEPCVAFPLRYDTFSREYSEPVILGLHGEAKSIQGLYQKVIGAMRFPVVDVEARFGITQKDNSATGKKGKRADVTQENAAALCGVGIRLVQYWDAGERLPEGYPGRGDAIVFATWANGYQVRNRLKATALAMNRATTINPQDLDSAHHQSAFDDD